MWLSFYMPYIPIIDRHPTLDKALTFALGSGELNYAITELCITQNPGCYEDYMKIIGTLECVKLEFYRRAVAPYEDIKKEQNGDVYPSH